MAKFLEAPQDLYAPLLDEAYKRRVALAQALQKAGQQSGQPSGSVPLGLGQMAVAGLGGFLEGKADRDALDQQNQYLDGVRQTEGAGLGALAERLKSFGGGAPGQSADSGPVPGAPPAPSQTFANSIGFTPDPSGVSGDSIRSANNAKDMASNDSLDKVVRTVYGEASNQGDLGEKAVAAVIMNRAKQANMDPRDVVLAKNQFEPWSDPKARERMLTLDPNSPEYRQALANVLAAQQGDDPTGGATHFYAPKAQAALGRSAPSWDNGTGVDIGDHRFFKLGYKGGGPNGTEALAQPPVSPQGQGGRVQVASNDPSVGAGSMPQQAPPAGMQMAQADQVPPLQAPQAPLPPMPGLPEGIDPNKLVPNFAARAATAQQFLKSQNARIVLTGQQMSQQLQKEATDALKTAEERGYDLRLFQYKHGVEQRDKVSEENRTHAWDATKTNQDQGFRREETNTKFGNDMSLERERHRLSALDPTGDQKDYQLAVEQAQQAGQKPPSYTEWKRGNNASLAPKTEGTIPPGYKAIRDPNGNIINYELIPGSPQAKEQADAEAKDKAAKDAQTAQSNIVVQDIDRALDASKGAFSTGFGGSITRKIPGTPAHTLSTLLDSIKGNVAFDKLSEMRKNSPTGGALGSVTENEGKLLQSVYGSLEQSQDEKEFRFNLRRLKNTYLDIIHGPGNGPRVPLADPQEGAGREPLKPGNYVLNPKTGKLELQQ